MAEAPLASPAPPTWSRACAPVDEAAFEALVARHYATMLAVAQ